MWKNNVFCTFKHEILLDPKNIIKTLKKGITSWCWKKVCVHVICQPPKYTSPISNLSRRMSVSPLKRSVLIFPEEPLAAPRPSFTVTLSRDDGRRVPLLVSWSMSVGFPGSQAYASSSTALDHKRTSVH